MEIDFFGANCFRMKTKETIIIVDDNLKSLGGKSPQTDKSVVFYTNRRLDAGRASNKSKLVIDTPGEFEVGDLTVTGVQARAHIDTEEQMTSTVFQFIFGGQTVTLLGHIHPDISADVDELISGTDLLIIPVGGNGYTLDPAGASKVIKKVEPEIVIPSQFDVKGLNYEVPAQPLEEFEKLPIVTLKEVVDSYKLSKNAEDITTGQVKTVILKPKA